MLPRLQTVTARLVVSSGVQTAGAVMSIPAHAFFSPTLKPTQHRVVPEPSVHVHGLPTHSAPEPHR
jgi:hypothetical protein